MAAVFPFRSFGTAYNQLGFDQRYPDLADFNGFWVAFGDF
jgi:hypothetical protein